MNRKALLWIIGIIAVIFIAGAFYQKSSPIFVITGQETMTRTAPSQVSPNQQFQITYTAQNTQGTWLVSIVDSVSGGCQFPAGTDYRSVLVSDAGTTRQVTVTAPSSGSCTFSGDYMFQDLIRFPDLIVTVTSTPTTECTSGQTRCLSSIARQECNNGYWNTINCPSGQICSNGACITQVIGTSMTCNEYCPTQTHAQCLGYWQISGTYPSCTCNWVCTDIPIPTSTEYCDFVSKYAYLPYPKDADECTRGTITIIGGILLFIIVFSRLAGTYGNFSAEKTPFNHCGMIMDSAVY